MRRTAWVILLSTTVTLLIMIWCYIRLPEYNIYQGFSSSGENYRYSEIYVIVLKPCNTTTVTNNIIKEYRKMNGTPNKLTVKLFHSKTAVTEGNVYYTVTIEYPEKEVTEPPEALRLPAL